MFKFKKILALLLIFSFIVSSAIYHNIYANMGVAINDTSISATVLQVLDTDAFKVSLDGTNEVALVKIRGTKGNGYDAGYEYLTNTILGEKVTLTKDGTSTFDGTWNYMVVYCNGVNIGSQLVANGYAIVDNNQNQGSSYSSLLSSQSIAQAYTLGVWQNQSLDYSSITNSGSSYYSTQKININTATLSQIKSILKGITPEVAENIISYRESNPFTTIQEIKFVTGFTAQMFTLNKDIMVVSTNINKASEYELATLGLSTSQIDSLIELRNEKDKDIKNTSELVPNVISSSTYNKIKYFISTADISQIDYRISSSIANVNASDQSYLQKVGLNYTSARQIVRNRVNGYTYKTLMELTKFEIGALSEEDINKYQDNLSLVTNLNSSDKDELIYLFGSDIGSNVYSKIFNSVEELKTLLSEIEYKKYVNTVYVNSFNTDYININTATASQLQSIGFTANQASKIISARPIITANNLPFDVFEFDSKISLYTNINTASRNELYSLGLDYDTINAIISYRNVQPFSTKSELKTFFSNYDKLEIYTKIENYIVFR